MDAPPGDPESAVPKTPARPFHNGVERHARALARDTAQRAERATAIRVAAE